MDGRQRTERGRLVFVAGGLAPVGGEPNAGQAGFVPWPGGRAGGRRDEQERLRADVAARRLVLRAPDEGVDVRVRLGRRAPQVGVQGLAELGCGDRQ